METIKYIKENGWEALTTELAIVQREYPEQGIVVLNYDQIKSPKTHPVVMECRSLILNKNTAEPTIISRAFDRFFNYGEVLTETAQVSFSNATIYEKADGSLVHLYHSPITNRWEVATRSMAYAESSGFHEGIVKAFGAESIEHLNNILSNTTADKEFTYVFEYISPDNRIVTPYTKAEMVLLGVTGHKPERSYETEDMLYWGFLHDAQLKVGLNVRAPATFTATNIDELTEIVNNMPGLDEGVVVLDNVSKKRFKLKSTKYLAAAGISAKTGGIEAELLELILNGEVGEFLSYYPDFNEKVLDMQLSMLTYRINVDLIYSRLSIVETQKEFALAAVKVPGSSILFESRKKAIKPSEVLDNMSIADKVKFYTRYVVNNENLSEDIESSSLNALRVYEKYKDEEWKAFLSSISRKISTVA